MAIGTRAGTFTNSDGRFEYLNNSDGTVKIDNYRGITDMADVVIPKEIDGKTVVQIEGLIKSGSKGISNLYIPEDIHARNLLLSDIINLSNTIIYESSINGQLFVGVTTAKIEDVLIFSQEIGKTEANNLTSKLGMRLHKAGDAVIQYNNGSKIYIRLFFYGSGYSTITNFSNERFRHLLWALKQHGQHNAGQKFEDIEFIDLSKVNNAYIPSTTPYSIKFNFDLTDQGIAQELGDIPVLTTANSRPSDLVDFEAPATDYSGPIYYTRQNTSGWNSVCLPFDIQETDFPTGTALYTFAGIINDEVRLNRLPRNGTIAAGTPCFVYSEQDSWHLTLTGRTIRSDVEPKNIHRTGGTLIGSFTTRNIGGGKYKLGSDGSSIRSTQQGSTIKPYRCYLESSSPSGTPLRISNE